MFTVLPHFVLRYRQRRPEVARDALLATHGGLSWELCAVLYPLSPMALYRLVCALGQQSLVGMRTRCGLPLPVYVLTDEKHSRYLTEKVYLPTIVSGRVLWHLGDTTEASAIAFTQSYQVFQRAALQREPAYRVRGPSLMASTVLQSGGPFSLARLGNASATQSISSRSTRGHPPSRSARPCAPSSLPLSRARQRKGCGVGARQRLHYFIACPTTAGAANGTRVRRWFQEKKAGWYAVLADPQMPATSALLDQAHNTIERKLFAMKGFHHPEGSQQAFLTALAHLYNLVPYQRRALHAGQCGVEVEGGRVPTRDWFLNVQILTSGGFR